MNVEAIPIGLERAVSVASGGADIADAIIAHGEIALPFGVVWIARDKVLDEGLAALILGEGGRAIPERGFHIAEQRNSSMDVRRDFPELDAARSGARRSASRPEDRPRAVEAGRDTKALPNPRDRSRRPFHRRRALPPCCRRRRDRQGAFQSCAASLRFVASASLCCAAAASRCFRARLDPRADFLDAETLRLQVLDAEVEVRRLLSDGFAGFGGKIRRTRPGAAMACLRRLGELEADFVVDSAQHGGGERMRRAETAPVHRFGRE